MIKSVKRSIIVLLSAMMLLTSISIAWQADAATAAGYVWPVNGGVLSQGFYLAGNSAHHAEHKGIDISAAYGTPIYAIKSGTVLCASTASADPSYTCSVCHAQSAGYHVHIKHDDGIVSTYSHMSSVVVTRGQTVSNGQKIGGMGNTGYSFGTHLHLALFKGWFNFANLVNPFSYITPFSSVYVDGITGTSATINATFGAPGTNIDQAGFYIGTSPDTMKKYTEVLNSNGKDGNGNLIVRLFYGTAKWCGTLQPGTTYYYRIWMKAYDAVYLTDIQTFKTTGGHTHAWNAGTVTNKPTCTASGIKTYTCSGCGATKTETIAATGHTWDDGRITTVPSCTANGIRTFTCVACKETKTQPVMSTGHTYKTVVVSPTVTAQGYLLHQCDGCGESYKSSYTDPIADPVHYGLLAVSTVFATPGSIVTVSVDAAAGSPIGGIAVDLSYDPSILEVAVVEEINLQCQSAFSIADHSKPGIVSYGYVCSKSANRGTLFRVTFNVKNSAPATDSALQLTVKGEPIDTGSDKMDIRTASNGTILIRTSGMPLIGARYGDVNYDHMVNSADALAALRSAVGKKDLTDSEKMLANVNGDSIINAEDVLLILKRAVGKILAFPIEME